MEISDTTADSDRAWTAAEPQSEPGLAKRRRPSCLTRGQRWLAGATAAAVLLSGLNATVQIWKVVAEQHGPSAALRCGPGGARQPSHKQGSPACSPGHRASRT